MQTYELQEMDTQAVLKALRDEVEDELADYGVSLSLVPERDMLNMTVDAASWFCSLQMTMAEAAEMVVGRYVADRPSLHAGTCRCHRCNPASRKPERMSRCDYDAPFGRACV